MEEDPVLPWGRIEILVCSLQIFHPISVLTGSFS